MTENQHNGSSKAPGSVELFGSPRRASIRAQRHAQQLASEFDLLTRGDWVYSIVTDADETAPDQRKGAFALGYRSWAPVQESGLVHESSRKGNEDAHVSDTVQAPVADACEPDTLPERFVLLIQYKGTEEHVRVPSEIDGVPVCALHNKVFANLRFLKSVVFPESVVRIGLKTFEKCKNLERVVFSQQLRSIDATTFIGCTSLAEVELPKRLESLERKTLEPCPVRCLELPPGLSSIAEQAINTSALEHIVVHGENEHYSSDGLALYSKDGSKLIRLYVPCEDYEVADGCTEIAESAFRDARTLRNVHLPQSIRVIGPYAFFNTGLTSIELPSSLQRIEARAFYLSERLEQAKLPEGLRMVGDFAFAKTSLSRVCLPASLEEIGEGIFVQTQVRFGQDATFTISDDNPFLASDGTGLYRRTQEGLVLESLLYLPETYRVLEGTVELGDDVFADDETIHMVELPESLVRIGASAFRNATALGDLALPEALEQIGDHAFENSGLTKLNLGPNVKTIGSAALAVHAQQNPLWGTVPLVVTVDERNEAYCMQDGFLCARDEGGALTCLLWTRPAAVAVVPQAATRIGPLCFNGACLETLHVHDGLTHVSSKAFLNMRGLKRAVVPTGAPGETATIEFPHDFNASEGAARSMGLRDDGSFFRFEDYDTWVMHYWLLNKRNSGTVARMILARLDQPVHLSAKARREFDNAMRTMLFNVFRYYTRNRDFGGFERLERHGYIDADSLERMLQDTQTRGETEATGYLLEMKNRSFGIRDEDFSL